jgi:hypothetical protein
MATRIDRVWPGRPRTGPERLRWALPHEPQWDGRQSLDEMWREIAAGKRPCLCPVKPGARRLHRSTPSPVPHPTGGNRR